jgi:hypothetical protein
MAKTDHDLLLGLGSAQSVTTRLLSMGYKDPKQLMIFSQYFAGKQYVHDEYARVGNPVTAPIYWPASCQADEPECAARVYALPVLKDEEASAPMIRRWEVLSESLDQRVTMVRNDKTPGKRIQEFAHRFVKLVVGPTPDAGEPYSLEETRDLLDKPSQTLAVMNIWDTVDVECRELIEAFVKNEACTKPPRIISSFADARFLLVLSSFTLKFRDTILHADHNKHWFMPGSTPAQIAERLREYVTGIDVPIEGDFANLDGSVSAWLQRNVMNAVYMAYFGNNPALIKMLNMLVSSPARAKKFGWRYDAGVGVKSGSPTTCDLNTVLSAFIMFCAILMTCPDLTDEDAFALIGLCFGDDTVFEKMFRKMFVKVANELGLTLKVEVCRPETGVTFLARVWPDILESLTSFQDPLRTWLKLHLTMRDPSVPIGDAAIDRLLGYLTTDELTPITAEYAKAVVRHYMPSESKNRRNRKCILREKPYWCTEGGSWPQSKEDDELMLNCISARTGISTEVLSEYRLALQSAKSPWEFPQIDRGEIAMKDGIDREGMPHGAVDLVLLERQHESNNLRASGVFAEGGGPGGGERREDDQSGWQRVSHGSKGPRGIPAVSVRPPGKAEPRNDRPPHQARGGRLPERGGGHRGGRGGRGGGGTGRAIERRQEDPRGIGRATGPAGARGGGAPANQHPQRGEGRAVMAARRDGVPPGPMS